MDIGAIFLLVSVGLLTILFVGRPFLERRRFGGLSASNRQLSALMAERDRLIGALQELDFDHTLGKIPSQDYPAMRSDLLQHAAEVLRHLDELQPQAVTHADAESRVEAVIAARRADAAVGNGRKPVISDEDIEELVASRRSGRKEKSAGFCPNCGKPVQRSDRFCPSCGKSIA